MPTYYVFLKLAFWGQLVLRDKNQFYTSLGVAILEKLQTFLNTGTMHLSTCLNEYSETYSPHF